ncbi:hypothetical protein [Vallicoccus soli]|uniref:Uncharacterized protein n=1 Tax=Vallicoccus soli TaxID=2339232 RepID=A0A3A3YWK4_9ACTN|nr:hypothetical protein [Vallicoccus soli]RJK95937.1 hypothetical protein D5H78_10095 [Vallicoccus soli]
MDAQLADLNARAAALVDAWLIDGDHEVLDRLQAVVRVRRDYLQPALLPLQSGWEGLIARIERNQVANPEHAYPAVFAALAGPLLAGPGCR